METTSWRSRNCSHLSPAFSIIARLPDSPVFKVPGDAIATGEVIGLIEVMKSFNEVRADAAGRMIRYLVDHEAEVMPGEPVAELDA